MNCRRSCVGLLLAAWALGNGSHVKAAVKPHGLFGDGMVLQQQAAVPVWGTADNGERVTVGIQGQEMTTTTANGRWIVWLWDLRAGGPFELTIRGTNTLTFRDVWVGEVWLCSGQSNMQFPVRSCADAHLVKAEPARPSLRLFTVPATPSSTPRTDVTGSWQGCGPDTVGSFSAVAYHFGAALDRALGVPVGLIHASYGGTPAEAWTSPAVLAADPDLRPLLEAHARARESYPERYRAYERAVAKARSRGERPPAPPAHPDTDPLAPGNLYNGMIAPLVPFAIRGVIWYQGESNCCSWAQYQRLFSSLIRSWRSDWNQGDFPFLFAQLAPYQKILSQPTDTEWARLREAQLWTSRTVPNTGMAVLTDVGDETDIHPRQKKPVGDRLALAARALAYGHQVEYSGPIWDRMQVLRQWAILSFRHTGKGLLGKGEQLTGFTICGPDRKFVPARAVIESNHVLVWSEQVTQPVAVRYGWANYPVGNLWNTDGLPASPFRTDDFPLAPPGR